MENKRESSVLIPYKIKDGKVFVFLQKRHKDSRVLAGYFAFFGGKIEQGENPTQALEREIKEELNFEVKDYHFLGHYQSSLNTLVVLNAYFVKVSDDFEDVITINEGEYGKFFSEDEVTKEPKLIESDKIIIKDLYNILRSKKEI